MRAALEQFFAASAGSDVLAAYLFGSHARGTSHAESDVDVAVLLDRDRLPSRAARAAAAERLTSRLIDVTHCNAIDVVVLNDAPPELAVAAIDASAPLFLGPADAVRAFERHIRLRLADLRPFLDRARRAMLESLLA